MLEEAKLLLLLAIEVVAATTALTLHLARLGGQADLARAETARMTEGVALKTALDDLEAIIVVEGKVVVPCLRVIVREDDGCSEGRF